MEAKEVLELVKKELRENNFSELTTINYCFFIEKFLKTLKNDSGISNDDIQNYLSTLSEKSSSTISLATASLKFLFVHVLKKPFPDFAFPKKERNIAADLSREEIIKMLGAADTKKSRLILSFLYSSGIKVSELVNLKTEDLDVEGKTGVIKKSLGGSRTIHFSEKLSEDLKQYLKDYKGLYLFSLHKPLTTRNIQKIVKNTAKRAGIEKKITPHTLRNSFAKHLLESGVDEKVVLKMLGYTMRNNQFDLEFQEKILKVKNPYDLLGINDLQDSKNPPHLENQKN